MAREEGTLDFGRLVVAWLFPPIGVLWQVGLKGPFWINLVLSLLFWFPGMVHAIWVIATTGPGGVEHPEGSKDFWRLLMAMLLPPVGVFMQVGLKGAFWLNLLLCFFFWVPGMLHAAWVITHTAKKA